MNHYRGHDFIFFKTRHRNPWWKATIIVPIIMNCFMSWSVVSNLFISETPFTTHNGGHRANHSAMTRLWKQNDWGLIQYKDAILPV